ncbi:cobalt-zinc-cadmium efflux system membrane fusion protein [Nitrosospira sp. Nsp5]|uniref:Membrane fusion protein, cobalt-zinc-cadmium efflux system n=1 Tax=Nitrosospira multiformis TaxID=1231 RepID=A0ABY0TGM2_9PROT|nr:MULTISPECIES: efflux RND transporter periplasmic adaptor subunit [Nitrosospira]PTR06316.1 cobalt-zinc-cadmium efflux system membrane fusion protein [Nitrosospira sp. Nsp5]SDQ58496.1 membrane fusion protein, cobalt-zinc-cadmium efflux system [Nitrosospira multiformis]
MKKAIRITGIAVTIVLLAAGCGSKEAAAPVNEAKQAPEDVNSITIRPEMVPRIKIGQPTMVDLADKLQVPSQVEVDEERLVRIGSYVTGRITDLYVMLGDSVNAGQPLARLTSPELTQAQLAYLRAYSRTVLTEKAAQRAQHLLAADVIAVAEVERRESELEVARAELGAAKDQLRLLGVDSAVLAELAKQGQILPSVTINASRSGIIIARSVIIGQVVQPADQLFGVADLSSVWVVGDVPEQIARNVQVGQHVEIHVPALGDVTLDGLIIFVADTVNPLTRTVMVRTMVENPQRKLKPDMLATMHITDNAHKSLVVPVTAVVREANRDYVFLFQGNNRFLRIPVELGPEVADMYPVLNGVTIDQKIVVDGAFHLDNERKLAELE